MNQIVSQTVFKFFQGYSCSERSLNVAHCFYCWPIVGSNNCTCTFLAKKFGKLTENIAISRYLFFVRDNCWGEEK